MHLLYMLMWALWPCFLTYFHCEFWLKKNISRFFKLFPSCLSVVRIGASFPKIASFSIFNFMILFTKRDFPPSHPYSLQLWMIERETSKTFSKSRWFIWNSAFVVGYVQPQFHWILAPKMMTQSKALKRHSINLLRSENKSDTTDFPDHYQANTTRALNLMAQQIVLWWLAYKSHSILEK